jgi:hypothetical protein
MSLESDPIPLRWYRRPQVEEAARAIHEHAQAGLLGPLDLALELSALLFRDGEGSYWFLDAWSAIWYRFAGQDWTRAEVQPPRLLEGLDGLTVPPAPLDPPPDGNATQHDAEASPTDALAAARAELVDAYREGRIASLDAELLLASSVLVDREGHLWAVGAASGAWYRDDAGWARMSLPPDLASLARLRRPPADGERACPSCGAPVLPELEGWSAEADARAARDLLAQAGSLPEPLTPPWDPPPGYPNLELPRVTRRVPLVPAEIEPGAARLIRCPTCGAEVREGVRFCGQCGTPLATLPGGAS